MDNENKEDLNKKEPDLKLVKDEVPAEEIKQDIDPVAEWKTKAAYFAAEIENMRKRFAKERLDLIKTGNESLVRALLPVLDNLEFAIKAASAGEQNSVVANLVKGVEMTLKHFEQTLEQIGVSPIKSMGTNFDPNLHEAMGESAEANIPNGQITKELQRGFSMGGRTLRTAKVIVNKIAAT